MSINFYFKSFVVLLIEDWIYNKQDCIENDNQQGWDFYVLGTVLGTLRDIFEGNNWLPAETCILNLNFKIKKIKCKNNFLFELSFF